MDTRTWVVFWCLAGAALSLLIGLGLSIVPPETRRRQLRRAVQAWYDLAGDVRSWWLRGIHYGTPTPPPPPPLVIIRATDVTQEVPVVAVFATKPEPAQMDEVEHEGATPDWSPMAELGGDPAPRDAELDGPPAPRAAELVRTALDPEAEAILRAFDAVVDGALFFDQGWLDFQASVDRGLVDAGLDPTTHQAWRALALVFDTDEYRQILSGQLVAS